MDMFFIYGIAGFSVAALITGTVLFIKARNAQTFALASSGSPEAGPSEPDTPDLSPSAEWVALNEDGQPLIRTRLISQIPPSASTFTGKDNVAVKRGQQLATDLFKGVATLPNKTIEVVFDPEIQKGLADDTLKIMKAIGDGNRAMAVNGKGQIVGHARLLEAGKVRPLAAGVFHLLSIAVAQSHLADINQSLSRIKSGLDFLQKTIDDKDHAALRGTMNYLEYLVTFMQDLATPALFPQEKRNQLEAIKHQTMQWVEQLQLESSRLSESIQQQESTDTFGTANTYQALSNYSQHIESLLRKRDVLLRILSLLDIGTAYLDPIGSEKWALNLGDKCSQSFAVVERLLQAQRDRSIHLLSNALFNTSSTLDERRNHLLQQNETLRAFALEHERSYQSTSHILAQQLKKYRDELQPIRAALTFDAQGEVSKVSML